MSEVTPGRPDHAIAALYAPETPVRCRVSVDLSMFSTNRVVVSWADCDQVPFIGDLVDAVDLLGQREAAAEVVGLDEDEQTISVAIDWTTVREVSP